MSDDNLTNEGTILVQGGEVEGTVSGNPPAYPSTVTVSLADSDGSPLGNTAVYGDTITITATISRAGSSGGNALAAADGHQVVFTIDGQEHLLREGEAIVMPAGHPHAVLGRERFKMLLVVVF